MEKLISKIRNKRLKGNISLLVILILLASSVISLLSINQIQRLMTYGNMTFNYFRAFYLAKAGTELGLTAVYNTEDGFSRDIGSGHAIVTGNLLTGYEGFEPYFAMTITGSFATITNDIRNSECNGNKINLATGAGIMLSLFYDDRNYWRKDNDVIYNLTDVREMQLKDFNPSDSELTFAFFIYDKDGNMKDIVVSTGSSLTDFLKDKDVRHDDEYKRYLSIKNSGDEPVEFCITMNGNLIPYSHSLVTVFGHYGDMEVGLQSVVKKGVPDWALNVIGEEL